MSNNAAPGPVVVTPGSRLLVVITAVAMVVLLCSGAMTVQDHTRDVTDATVTGCEAGSCTATWTTGGRDYTGPIGGLSEAAAGDVVSIRVTEDTAYLYQDYYPSTIVALIALLVVAGLFAVLRRTALRLRLRLLRPFSLGAFALMWLGQAVLVGLVVLLAGVLELRFAGVLVLGTAGILVMYLRGRNAAVIAAGGLQLDGRLHGWDRISAVTVTHAPAENAVYLGAVLTDPGTGPTRVWAKGRARGFRLDRVTEAVARHAPPGVPVVEEPAPAPA